MSSFSHMLDYLRAREYVEVGIPTRICKEFLDDISVRTFATPSESDPGEGYILSAVKNKKAGWANGTAVIVCSCMDAMLKFGLVWCGKKTPCKHAIGLRTLLVKFPGGFNGGIGVSGKEASIDQNFI